MSSHVIPNKAIIGLGWILKLKAEFKISNIENQNCVSLVHDQNIWVRSALNALPSFVCLKKLLKTYLFSEAFKL